MKYPKQNVHNSVGIEIKSPSGFSIKGETQAEVKRETQNKWVLKIKFDDGTEESAYEADRDRALKLAEHISLHGFAKRVNNNSYRHYPGHRISIIDVVVQGR